MNIHSVILSCLVFSLPAILSSHFSLPASTNQAQTWITLILATILAGTRSILGYLARLLAVESARLAGIKLVVNVIVDRRFYDIDHPITRNLIVKLMIFVPLQPAQ